MGSALGKNHFELLGLPVGFDVDIADLRARYRDLQRQLHPDRFASAPDAERRLSMQLTAQLNEAFHTLRDPVRRGQYLLELRGVDARSETDTEMDPGFLMEQMELRETLEALREGREPRERLAQMAGDIEKRQNERINELSRCFKDPSPESERRAGCVLREMQFFQKLMHEIEALEEDLD